MVSVSSRSRSVALKASFERSALTRTLARIGIVLRRSTTRWTWPSDFNRAVRSTVTFMPNPAPDLVQGQRKWRVGANFARVEVGFWLVSHTIGFPPTRRAGCQLRRITAGNDTGNDLAKPTRGG